MPHSDIHVVAVALFNRQNEVLLTQRLPGKHLAGCWEFPGGKIEANESPLTALKRELQEELGIKLSDARPLIKIAHRYPDRQVTLDVWQATAYDGVPHGKEGQALTWVATKNLKQWTLPAANDAIVTALQLSSHYLITPEPEQTSTAQFLLQLEKALTRGNRLLQFRAHTLSPDQYQATAIEVMQLCQRYETQVLLNTSIDQALELNASGVHLNSPRLHELSTRPPTIKWLAASCHTTADIIHACNINVDFIVLSPVKSTLSHPDAKAIGWPTFQSQVKQSTVPVYALGGLTTHDTQQAWQHGAQGIAAIRGLWE
ncbi:MAG: Nudix family hydrolase [Gammaproteobacteria bacterium]|nr:Nudix family hydrolase [Gammaproteobacteria bacterium]